MAIPLARSRPRPRAGTYLTDGERLVMVLGPGPDGSVRVEDAKACEVQTLGAGDIARWRMVNRSSCEGERG